jgi:hypothetical protein
MSGWARKVSGRERASVESDRVDLQISLRTMIAFNLLSIVVLASTSLFLQYLHHETSVQAYDNLIRLFDLDQENNLPTWYSSANLGFCAILLFLITKSTVRGAARRHFAGLCAAFLYLSIDEAASLHEIAIRPIRRALGTSGAFHSGWVIPAIPIVAVFTIAYLRFFLSLPRRYQVLFFLAAAFYIGGAVGLEMVSWHHLYPRLNPLDPASSPDFTYALLNHAEEVCEMIGVAVFACALLDYVKVHRIIVTCAAKT